jgi:hypothetical protein
MSLKGFLVIENTGMICIMCHQQMDNLNRCQKDGLIHWSVREMQEIFPHSAFEEFMAKYPSQDAYWFAEHYKLYTVDEMMRICRLKAFL